MTKNYCKKTLAGIFAFAIVASAIPLAPFATNGISLTASAETYFKDGFNYEIENGECTITGYPGYGDAQIVIPDNFDGVPVTAIGSQSLNMLFNTTSIVIPNTVKTIGTNAFASCTALTTIVIPNSVTSIGANAFSYCQSLESIDIPNSVTSIGNKAFDHCEALTSVVLPDSVEEIGTDVFNGCTKLETIYAPCSISGSSSSWKGNNPAVVQLRHAFSKDSNECFCGQTIQYDYDNGTIIRYEGEGSDVVIPSAIDGEDITAIGDLAFENRSAVKSVTIPSCITSIGKDVFEGCDALTTIYYAGSEDKWNTLDVDAQNEKLFEVGVTFLHAHIFPIPEKSAYTYDETAHWLECGDSDCDITDYTNCVGAAYGVHVDANGDFYCDTCGYYDEAAALEQTKQRYIQSMRDAVLGVTSGGIPELLAQAESDVMDATTVQGVYDVYNNFNSNELLPLARAKAAYIKAVRNNTPENPSAKLAQIVDDAITAINAATTGEEVSQVASASMSKISMQNAIEGMIERLQAQLTDESSDEDRAIVDEAVQAMYATDDPNVAGEISYYAGQDLRFDAFMAETLTYYRELRDDYTERGIEECVALCNDALERIPNLTKAKDVAAIEREINNKLDVVENYWKIETYYSDGPESVQDVITDEVDKIEANTDLKAKADQSYLSVDAIKKAYDDELALAKEDAVTELETAAGTSPSDAMTAILTNAETDIDAAENFTALNTAIYKYQQEILTQTAKESTVPLFTGNSAIVDGTIGLIFHAVIPAEYLDGSVTISMNGAEDVTFTSADFVKDEQTGDYLFTYDLNAIQMAETVTAVFYDKDGEEVTRASQNLEDYLTKLTKSEELSEDSLTYLNALLTYGYCAQQALSSVNGWTIGEDYAAMKGTYAPQRDRSDELAPWAYEKVGSTDDSITALQYSVLFDHAADLILYVTADTKPTVAVDGEYIDVEEAGNGVWKAVIPDHNAYEFENQYLIQVNDSLLLWNVSVLSYANSMLSDAEMVPFASAIIELCTAAHSFH